MGRRILHLDMDAFFASVEQLDHPEYRGKPLIVGGSSDRGVVAAASYEVRKYGVRSAMPMVQARRLCPHAVVVSGRMGRYKEVSERVMAVLGNFSPLVEQASVDEAYVDVSGCGRLFGPPEALAGRVKADIRAATGLACSVGIAPVKFLAKIASDRNKPDGIFILEERDVAAFLAELDVGAIPGVGKRALAELHSVGVRTCGDMLRFGADFWERRFGKWGLALYDRARGIDPREVTPHVEPKSESAENTFERDTRDKEELRRWMLVQSERVGRSLRAMGRKGRTVTLKIKYSDFRLITRSRTLASAVDGDQDIFSTASELLEELALERDVRLVGVGVSNFGEGERQYSLFPDPEADRRRSLDKALDEVRGRFGGKAVVRGRLFDFDPRK